MPMPALDLSLPVDALVPEIIGHLRRANALVLEAAPGAGKTTRVPPALMEFGNVAVLEPRRLAARMAAQRVAAERGEKLGESVGYQVRFEEISGPKTRLKFLTEGLLTRRLVSDPELRGIDVVVLDEFHERHLDGDFALALVRRLQKKRPELKLVVMSATMDADAVARHLGDCPVVRSEGRLFDTRVEYRPVSATALEEQVAQALEKVMSEGLDGDVLVFLPGAREIRAAMRTCEGLLRKGGLLGLPLYGDLPPAEQDRAVMPAQQRKVIFSTNVAESSVTIDGVTVVIDSGLARVARDSPDTGLPELAVQRVSQASANQRAGRAGRTRPGRVIRLFPLEDFVRRPKQDTAEILRRELTGLCLDLRVMKIRPAELDWLDAPPEVAWAAAEALLDRLGATEAMAKLPLHPRLAVLVTEANTRGAGEAGCQAAALLSTGVRTKEPMELLRLLDRPMEGATQRVFQQLTRFVRPRRGAHNDIGLLHAVLRAYPDRVRKGKDGKFLVALDVEERRERNEPLLRLFARIEPEWLIDVFPERVVERDTLEWHRTGERVEQVSALVYEGLVISETRGVPSDPEAAAALLAEKAMEAGLHRFADMEELEALRQRVAFAAEHSAIEPLDDNHLRRAVANYALGCRSFNEMGKDGFVAHLLGSMTAGDRKLLDEVAPERVKLASGRQAKVRYETGKAPVVASRLQDFFGMRETPRAARGQVPMVIELLAPNHRPVQTTTDLAGFWERLYPQVRKELMRRYPRHAWPESPF